MLIFIAVGLQIRPSQRAEPSVVAEAPPSCLSVDSSESPITYIA